MKDKIPTTNECKAHIESLVKYGLDLNERHYEKFIKPLFDKIELLENDIQNNKKQPKYNLNQMLRVKSIGLVLTVKVTKRIERIERNLDTGEEQTVFLYDLIFEHEKPLDWYEVPEENLDEMVYLANQSEV